MLYGAAGRFGQGRLNVVVAGLADMIPIPYRSARPARQRRDTTELLAGGLKTGKVAGGDYGGEGIYHSDAFDREQ